MKASTEQLQYTEFAVKCDNVLPDDVCLLLYTKAVEEGKTDERNEKCFQVNSPFSFLGCISFIKVPQTLENRCAIRVNVVLKKRFFIIFGSMLMHALFVLASQCFSKTLVEHLILQALMPTIA